MVENPGRRDNRYRHRNQFTVIRDSKAEKRIREKRREFR